MQTELIPVTAADVEQAAAWLAEAKRDLDAATDELAEARTAHKQAQQEFTTRLGDWLHLRQRLAATAPPARVAIGHGGA